MGWTGWRDALLELIFPGSHLCYFCWEKIGEQRVRGVCDNCCGKILQLNQIRGVCPHCSCYTTEHPCPNCLNWTGALTKVVSVVPYEGIYREMITDIKYSGRTELIKPLAFLMACQIKRAGLVRENTVLVPVPLHPLRETERGFNQSSLLAREIAGRFGLCCEEGILKRVHYSNNQTGLGKRERLVNIKEAFEADHAQCGKIAGKSVLLIDDIITTGATLNACAEALQRGTPCAANAAVWASGVTTKKNKFAAIAGR